MLPSGRRGQRRRTALMEARRTNNLVSAMYPHADRDVGLRRSRCRWWLTGAFPSCSARARGPYGPCGPGGPGGPGSS